MEQLLLHMVGDYLIQNDWMALNKKKKGWLGFGACLVHCVTYTLPFLLITQNPMALYIIFFSHFLIDRTHLIEHFLAFRNGAKATVNFGFAPSRPKFISVWLYIIADNVFHLLFNYSALTYFN